MAKFSGSVARTRARTAQTAPIKTKVSKKTGVAKRTTTHEGAGAYKRTSESDLFLLAATNMVGEDTFYESGSVRDNRYLELIQKVTHGNPSFIAGGTTEHPEGMAKYLRNDLKMRSASIVMAAEYLAAGGPLPRSVISSVLQRPDEPAEMIGYWLGRYGKGLPMALKRGIADALPRLFTERNVIRYDGQSHEIRFADVIEMCHPDPVDSHESALFKYLLDRRHADLKPTLAELKEFPVLQEAQRLEETPENKRRALLRTRGADVLSNAGFSWERMSSWLPGGMDAEAWEAIAPTMGVMALVRNLRNFDEAKISDKAVDQVITKITDPTEVERARLFPYQIWSAYKNAPSDNWKRALGTTLDLTTANIPNLDGTLIVIDTSGSMQAGVSGRSQMTREEIAGVMAMATAKQCSDVDVVIFGQTNKLMTVPTRQSVLAGVQMLRKANGSVGHSTYGHTAIQKWFDPKRHKRVVMFTDDQQHDQATMTAHVPVLYTFNLAGYAPSSTVAGSNGRYTLGGFSDATFTIMSVLEAGKSASWPF